MLVRGMVDDEIDHDAHAEGRRLVRELDEVAQRTEARIDAVVIRHVVAVIAPRRAVEGVEPDASHAQASEVGQAMGESLEVADAIAVAVLKRFDVQRVDDGVLVPEIVDTHPESLLMSRGFAPDTMRASAELIRIGPRKTSRS